MVNSGDIALYADIPVGDNVGHSVEVLRDIKLKQIQLNPGNIELESEFVIDSEFRDSNGHKPLVLPIVTYTENTIYTKTNRWNKDTKVPSYDPVALNQRILPNEGTLYPYLTVSDFLTDTIVRLPYEINKESYFDGNINKADNKGYLLPLTDLFFECFSVEDLQGTLKNGKKMFELENNASGGITAVLRVPIQKNKIIEYRRTYFESDEVKIEENEGKLIEKTFCMSIMPLIKFPDNVKKHYRIALSELDTTSTGARDVKLTCWKETEPIPVQSYCVRDKKNVEESKSSVEAYAFNENFDRMSVRVGNVANCVLVPKFSVQKVNATKKFIFAVDFGTTNTHIEYSADGDGGNPVTFDISEKEKQLHHLHSSIFFAQKTEMETLFRHNFIPDVIADNTQYSFPIRTAFTECHDINYNTQPDALVEGNIPFIYEKEMFQYQYLNLQTELKWKGVADGTLRLYLENLFLLIRNKVLLNGGNLANVKIIWFYPASMDEGRLDLFAKTWNKLYKIYFGDNTQDYLLSISESAAPYYYYRKKQGAKSEVVTIDIGGGTTDVYVVEKSVSKMLLSFRFASEAVFGDAYGYDSDKNGFVNWYMDKFIDVLEDCKLETLQGVLKQIEQNKKSPDIVAFFFSLANNQSTKDKDSLNFMEQLSENEFLRYVFIVFYGAILYFIAKAMKAKGLLKPRTLAFSGNGSKSLNALSANKDKLELFAKLIFDGVYGTDDGDIKVIKEENPKKATCKGGILEPIKQEYNKIAKLKHVFIGDNFDDVPAKKTKYSDITDTIKGGIVQQVSDFMEFLFQLHEDNDDFFTSKLAAHSGVLETVRKICLNKSNIEGWLDDGLQMKLEMGAKDAKSDGEKSEAIEAAMKTNVSESLFFYPLVGVLHEIARKLSEMN